MIQFHAGAFLYGWGPSTVQPNAQVTYTRQREAMVGLLRIRYMIDSEPILAAMSKVRRHVYIPESFRASVDTYGDHPCPIGYGQTISQPFIVAHMTEKIDPKPGHRILEVGSGSGYQAAVLAEMGAEVYSMEIVPELAKHAAEVLESEGYRNAHVVEGDGYKGLPERSPFDCIIVTCSPEEIPKALEDQLKEGGKLILPLDTGVQQLIVLRKMKDELKREEDIMVRFVPMVHGKRGVA